MTIDMFTSEGPTFGPAIPEEPPRFLFEIATRKAKIKGWKWFSSRIVGEGKDAAFIVTGGVPHVLKAGPNKGAERWDRKAATDVVVTRAEVDAAESLYERTTGRCRRCAGSKVHMVESSAGFIKYGQCWLCKGTGQPLP